jgi:acetoin utilization protein AcuB
MIVSMWMNRDVATIQPHTPIVEAATLMAAKHIRRLPVVIPRPTGPYLEGIITSSDILHAFPPHINPFGLIPEAHRTRTTAADIMHPQVVTTTPEAPMEEAARIMRDRKIGALPVVRDGHLIGMITESDVFRAFVSLFELPPGGARITFDLSKSEDILRLVSQAAGKHAVRVLSLITLNDRDHPRCVVWATGSKLDAFMDDLWKSGHHVLSVLRIPHAPESLNHKRTEITERKSTH